MKLEDEASQPGVTGKSGQASSPGNLNADNWVLLGELELVENLDIDRLIEQRLRKILRPFNMHGDFLNKLLMSVQEAVSNRIRVGTEMRPKQARLLVFALKHGVSNGHDWGFFRIVKLEGEERNTSSDRVIEFYLYQE
jgi:hypothetical protein